MLFSKPIREITYENVVEFCNQKIRENFHLEYKVDFNEKAIRLAKTLAAFANTYGGLVIIGVGDNDGEPLLPVEGVEYKKGFHERITKIIIDNVYPIFFPEIEVCKNNAGNKAFVIVRIPQSDGGPHAILGNTETYVRVNDIKNPEKLATMEQIEWLKNSRQKSENLKSFLIDQARSRHSKERYLDMDKEHIVPKASIPRRTPLGHGYYYSIPLYPNTSYSSPDELNDILGEICVEDYYGTYPKFPRLFEGRKVASDSVVIKEDDKSYTELNEFGLFFHGEKFMKDMEDLKKTESHVDVNKLYNGFKMGYYRFFHLLARLDEELELSHSFLRKLGYWGYIEISFHLKDLDMACLYYDGEDSNIIRDGLKESLDYDFEWTKIILVNDLMDKRIELLKDFCKNLGWCYGWQLTEKLNNNLAEDYLKKNNRLKLADKSIN